MKVFGRIYETADRLLEKESVTDCTIKQFIQETGVYSGDSKIIEGDIESKKQRESQEVGQSSNLNSLYKAFFNLSDRKLMTIVLKKFAIIKTGEESNETQGDGSLNLNLSFLMKKLQPNLNY